MILPLAFILMFVVPSYWSVAGPLVDKLPVDFSLSADVDIIHPGDGKVLVVGPNTWSFSSIKRVQDFGILLNAVSAAGGFASELRNVNNKVYAYAADHPYWYVWNGASWESYGLMPP